MSRLLTGLEIVTIMDNAREPCPMEFRDEPKIRAVAKAQAKLTKEETLKAVGERIRRIILENPNPFTLVERLVEEIGNYQQGKIPDVEIEANKQAYEERCREQEFEDSERR